jgi:hypothetical protein
MEFSQAISRVKWLSGLLTSQPFDPADSPRELHPTQSPGKQQIPHDDDLYLQLQALIIF